MPKPAAEPKPPTSQDIAKDKLKQYMEGSLAQGEITRRNTPKGKSAKKEYANLVEEYKAGNLSLEDLGKRLLTTIQQKKFSPEMMTAGGVGAHLGPEEFNKRMKQAWDILGRNPTRESVAALFDYLEELGVNAPLTLDFEDDEDEIAVEEEIGLEAPDGTEGNTYSRIESSNRPESVGEQVTKQRAFYDMPAMIREKMAADQNLHEDFRSPYIRIEQDQTGGPKAALRVSGNYDTWEASTQKPIDPNTTVTVRKKDGSPVEDESDPTLRSFYISRTKETLKSYIQLKKLNPNNYVIAPIPSHLRNNMYLKSVNYNVENPNFKYMLVHKSFITFTNDATPVLKVKDLKENEDAKKNNNPESKKNNWEYVKKYGKMNSKTKGIFDNRDPNEVLSLMDPDEIDDLLKTSPEFQQYFQNASDQALIDREETMDRHAGAGSGEQFSL